jgi:AmmeMemoRadiSam system protein B
MAEARQRCRLVLLSFSLLSLQEHVKFGAAVGEAMLEAEQRVLYVASSDLSHRLIPGAPAGYDPRGAEFDKRVVETFAEGDWRGLLSIDPELVDAAGECGYRSLAVLSGVVSAVHATGVHTQNHVLSYEGPFGVGYLVGEVQLSETAGAVQGQVL